MKRRQFIKSAAAAGAAAVSLAGVPLTLLAETTPEQGEWEHALRAPVKIRVDVANGETIVEPPDAGYDDAFFDRLRRRLIILVQREGRGIQRIEVAAPEIVGGELFRFTQVWMEGWHEWQPPYSWYQPIDQRQWAAAYRRENTHRDFSDGRRCGAKTLQQHVAGMPCESVLGMDHTRNNF